MMPRCLTIASRWLLALAGCLSLSACLQTAGPPRNTGLPNYEQAIAEATEKLIGQTSKLPGFLARVESVAGKKRMVVDPMIDVDTGQQTAATRLLEQRITARIAAEYPQYQVVPFLASELARAEVLLTGTIGRESVPGQKQVLKINLAITDLKQGTSLAQASAIARAEDVNNEPTPYYRDSPLIVKDASVQAYARTAATPPGQRADNDYLQRLGVSATINEATKAYDEQRYPQALEGFRKANAEPGPPRLKALTGEYMALVNTGRMQEAETAFGRVVAFAIRNDVLQIRFLFVPGSVDFWTDRAANPLSAQYPMWLRQIAREAGNANACMAIVGHTSRTGSEAFNDKLSQQRAQTLQQRLTAEVKDLSSRTKPVGRGWRENLVGSGTDNAQDAPDRRVEFRVMPCGQLPAFD